MITAEEALECLEEIVRDFGPETTYADVDAEYAKAVAESYSSEFGFAPACRYHSHGKPLCIVGQVFARLGLAMPPENLAIDALTDDGLTESARGLLRVAQVLQDSEETWGEALVGAKSHYLTHGETEHVSA